MPVLLHAPPCPFPYKTQRGSTDHGLAALTLFWFSSLCLELAAALAHVLSGMPVLAPFKQPYLSASIGYAYVCATPEPAPLLVTAPWSDACVQRVLGPALEPRGWLQVSVHSLRTHLPRRGAAGRGGAAGASSLAPLRRDVHHVCCVRRRP